MAANIAAAIKIVLAAVDRASAPIRAVTSRLGGITAAAGKARLALAALANVKGLDRLKAGLGGLLGSLRGAAGQMAGLAAPAAALFGGASIAGILGAVKATSDYAGDMLDAAKITGVAVDQFQSLAYAAEQNGVQVEDLSKTFLFLNRNLAAARAGGKKQQEMFAAMGISMSDIQNLSPDEIMRKLADSFSKIQNPSLRTAAAMALFGKSGAALIPMLIDGRSAIEEFEGTANRLGLVLNPDDMRRVEVFSDNVSTLMQAIHGLARAIAVQVIPHLDPLVTKMTEWVAANRQLIATRAGEFIEQLAGWLQRIDFDAVLQGITDFVAGVQRVVDWLGGWSNALTILALGMTGLLGPMISVAGGTAQVAIGLTRLLPGLAAATGGFARFGLRVAALAVGLGGRLALALVGLVPALGALIPPLLSVGAAILATPIGWILAGIAALAAAVYLIVDNWSTLGEFFSGLWDGIKGLFGGLVGWFADIGGRLIGGLWDGVKSAWGSFWGWISDAIGGLLRLIGAPMAALTGMAVNAVTGGGAAPPASSAFVGGNQAAAASLLPAMPSTRAQVGGEMVVRFENPPEGMTVKSATSDTPGLTFRPDLGPAFGIA